MDTHSITINEIAKQHIIINQRPSDKHRIYINVETSSRIDHRPIHNRSLELKRVNIHPLHHGHIQRLGRRLSVETKLFLQAIQPIPEGKRHLNAEREIGRKGLAEFDFQSCPLALILNLE